MGPRRYPIAPAEDGVEAAIARVLSAEREAQGAIEAAGREAERRLAEARLAARRVAERAEARILAARRSIERRIAEHEARVRAGIEALRPDESLTPGDLERVRAAAERLARELTGGAP